MAPVEPNEETNGVARQMPLEWEEGMWEDWWVAAALAITIWLSPALLVMAAWLLMSITRHCLIPMWGSSRWRRSWLVKVLRGYSLEKWAYLIVWVEVAAWVVSWWFPGVAGELYPDMGVDVGTRVSTKAAAKF